MSDLLLTGLEVVTKLDAINACLAAIGELPVDSEDEANVDTGNAASTIERVSRQIQNNKGSGLWFNRETGWRLAPDTEGFVLLPNNVLSITFARDKERYFYPDDTYRLTKRGNKVYDLHNHTYDLTAVAERTKGTINPIEVIVQLEFEDTPQVVKDAITAKARHLFALDFEADYSRVDRLEREAREAMLHIQAANLKQRKLNRQTDSNMLRNFTAKAGGYNNPR